MFASGPLPGLSQRASADERRIARLFRALDAQQQQTLLSFAEFLSERSPGGAPGGDLPGDGFGGGRADAGVPAPVMPQEPQFEARPAQESVVAGIRRLRRTYPMLDSSAMLNEASTLMAAHVLRGRAASAVIDDLEALFAQRFETYRGRTG